MQPGSSVVTLAVKDDSPHVVEPVTSQHYVADNPVLPVSASAVLRDALVQDELVGPVTPARQVTPTHSRKATAFSKDTASFPTSVSPSMTRLTGEERASLRSETLATTVARLEAEMPASVPTVQITIGRVEVRATPAPKSNAQPRQQRSAPAAMGLDEYLRQRSQGGRL
jgi:hypothetical protein